MCNAYTVGDTPHAEVCFKLFMDTVTPYLHVLNSWIMSGIIDDPDNVFMIQQGYMGSDSVRVGVSAVSHRKSSSHSSDASAFWRDRFSLRNVSDENASKNIDDCVPNFLQDSANDIFVTGKSLCIIRDVERVCIPYQLYCMAIIYCISLR